MILEDDPVICVPDPNQPHKRTLTTGANDDDCKTATRRGARGCGSTNEMRQSETARGAVAMAALCCTALFARATLIASSANCLIVNSPGLPILTGPMVTSCTHATAKVDESEISAGRVLRARVRGRKANHPRSRLAGSQ